MSGMGTRANEKTPTVVSDVSPAEEPQGDPVCRAHDHERREHGGKRRGPLRHGASGPRGQRNEPGMQRGLVQVREAVQARQQPVAFPEDVPRQHGKPRLVVRGKDPGAEIEEEERCAHPEEQGDATAGREDAMLFRPLTQ